MSEVIQFKDSDLRWEFSSAHPRFLVPDGSYERAVEVDTFPGYSHDIGLVRRELADAEQKFPLGREVKICVLSREAVERTNGWCAIGHDYTKEKEDNEYPWSATIILSAKRIPIHPAMTRYLVSHEYGHAVYQFLKRKSVVTYDQYEKLRGSVSPKYYGGGTWHLRTEELFANDFRILVANKELEFWPHSESPRPEEIPAIKEFWASQTTK